MNKNVFLFCVRNLCGTGEVNYLLNLSDFIKKFVEGTNRRSMFASGNTEEDYKLFEEQLRDVGFADWYLTNNDSFVVYLCDEQNLEGFLLGEYNQDPIESILNNRNDDESIVTTIETYIRCCNWYISTDDSTSAVLDWAKSLYPELVSDMLHEMTFQEAVAALQDKMCFDERKACEDYLEELRVAENKRLTLWNGVRWVLPQGYGFGQKIADRLAAYENTGLEPEEIEKLKTPTAEMLSLNELERAFRIRDRQYAEEDARHFLQMNDYAEEEITDDLIDRMIDLFDEYATMDESELVTWDYALQTIRAVDAEDAAEKGEMYGN